jgi:hypothetical protein
MATTTRAQVIVGPGKFTRNALSVHSKDNFNVRETESLLDIAPDAYGAIDGRAIDALVKVSFTPDGRWTSDIRSLLFPYLNPTIGSDIFTTSDVPATIHDNNAHVHTLIASACTKMPSLKLSAKETLIGDCEFTGVRGTGQAWSVVDKLYTVALTGGTIVDTAYALSDFKVQVYSAVWTGVTGFTGGIFSVDGFTVDSKLDIEFIQIDEIGTVKGVLKSVQFMVKFRPLQVTYANILLALKSQGTGASRGRSLAAAGADLLITGADASTIITLKGANLYEGGFQFGSTVVRDGELAFIGTRAFASGVPGALLTLA